MTDWLIHFTHKSKSQTALATLGNILMEGVLRPGFAPRGNPPQSTIYGPHPAVCFTEQPVARFIDYLVARQNDNALSGYGLFIHKHDVYAAGGLPVIYGLHQAVEISEGEDGYDPQKRILCQECLPFTEQYRYVTHVPNGSPSPIDWTHEREWRWSPHVSQQFENQGLFWLGGSYTGSRGSFRGRVHAFVNLDSEIETLQQKIKDAYDNSKVGQFLVSSGDSYPDCWDSCLRRVRVVSLETVGRELKSKPNAFSRFENIPNDVKQSLLVDAG